MARQNGMVLRTLLVSPSMILGSQGCGGGQCTCGADGALQVTAPSEQITDVVASDVGCNGVDAACIEANDAGVCTHYRIEPTAIGNCHIDVDLVKGTRFSADVRIEEDCCGFHADPPAAALIEVP